jgi:hypothetical protein
MWSAKKNEIIGAIQRELARRSKKWIIELKNWESFYLI